MSTFGERVRAAREQLGMKQRELSEKIGLQPLQISRWERDDVKKPDVRALATLANMAGRSVDYFLTGVEVLPDETGELSDEFKEGRQASKALEHLQSIIQATGARGPQWAGVFDRIATLDRELSRGVHRHGLSPPDAIPAAPPKRKRRGKAS